MDRVKQDVIVGNRYNNYTCKEFESVRRIKDHYSWE